MQMAEEAVCAQDRDPYTAFENRVNELNYGNSYFFRPITKSDLQKVDPLKACEYFIKCFKDPSTFTVVIVGNIDPTIALPLILQYLGGIPKPHEPIMHLNRDELKGLPFTFPKTIFREVVRSPMVEEQCLVQLCFPVELKNGTMVEEIHFVGFLSKLLETKIMQVLRFKHGQVYSVTVSVFLGGNKPSRTCNVRGDISISFSCDPEISSKLVDLTLDEMLRLQEEGPTDHDVSTILEIEQRAHENGLQENYYWLDMILDSYQSRAYSGDVGISFEIQDKGRSKVRSSLNPSTAQLALQRILPFPCTKQYTVVILMPKSSPFKLLKSVFQLMRISHGRDAKILAGIAGLVVLALSLWRHSRSANLHSRDMS
ncbi:putative metalloenzyme, LuxS/M16 peptidase [Lupinus albus]|uniref:Putative metalloenzyme, LuxS/M16 peptidase n=1 Tax=Lupinus albus TaxID=3870 RepID=A0A6A4Q0X5_LUPAL|nr:putative metalloenzyme, LuxS/M16 peptidase [Lupinus albus]